LQVQPFFKTTEGFSSSENNSEFEEMGEYLTTGHLLFSDCNRTSKHKDGFEATSLSSLFFEAIK
jgi:hypothetical protein